MNTIGRITKVLAIGCVCAVLSLAQNTEGPDVSKPSTVMMEITALDVNDSRLTLSYNIINGTGRDAWVCDSISSSEPFEVFLTSDRHTLLIRKRLDVPTTAIWRPPGPAGTYVRIAPDASLANSVQIALPVSPRFLYATPDVTDLAQTVMGLSLEIGYYDTNLPLMIREIIALAEKSGLTISDIPGDCSIVGAAYPVSARAACRVQRVRFRSGVRWSRSMSSAMR